MLFLVPHPVTVIRQFTLAAGASNSCVCLCMPTLVDLYCLYLVRPCLSDRNKRERERERERERKRERERERDKQIDRQTDRERD